MRFRWPEGYVCAAAFTFDVDGETIPLLVDRQNARRRLSLQSQASYGPDVGAPRILDLLGRYGVKGSFYIPGFTAELHEDLVERFVAEGHEVGHHGYMHEGAMSLSYEEEEEVLLKGVEVLEGITGRRPIGYRAPSWELNPWSPALLHKHGFLYDSSLMGNDVPYLIEAGAEKLIELPVQWLLDDAPYFGITPSAGVSSPDMVLETWRSEFEGMYEENGVFIMTMHPFISGRPSRVRMLEQLIRHVRSFPGVWITTLEEIGRHCADNVSEMQMMKHRLVQTADQPAG